MQHAHTLRDALIECFRAHAGGPLAIKDVSAWIERQYPRQWKDVSTPMADLTIDGNTSSPYHDGEKCLIRVRRGVYRLDDAHVAASAAATAEHATNDKCATPPTAKPEQAVIVADSINLWIAGIPVTFATAGEKSWRAALAEAIPQAPNNAKHVGVELSFALEGDLRGGHAFDLDNLCEPVFSVLINRKRWCYGRRPNIRWWSARRSVASPTGCTISLRNDSDEVQLPGRCVFTGAYIGPFPSGATDTLIADWLSQNLTHERIPDRHFSVSLRFGSKAINLGDIATGPVKSVIDNLFPVIGGRVQSPEDWRIKRLFVRKAEPGLQSDALHIEIRTE